MRRVAIAAIVVAAAAIFDSASLTASQQGDDAIGSMKGLAGVQIVVESLGDDVERLGLRREDIATDVELQLRLAAVPVLSREASLALPRQPWLYVRANVMVGTGSNEVLCIYSLDVSLHQAVWVVTDPPMVMTAVTWSTGSFGTIGSRRVREIRQSIKDHVGKFLNAWLTANPKK